MLQDKWIKMKIQNNKYNSKIKENKKKKKKKKKLKQGWISLTKKDILRKQ